MGMNLDHGGHLTHGSPANFSGVYFNIVPYGVNDEERPTFTYPKYQVLIGKDVFANYLCQDLRWHIGINAWNNLFDLGFLRKNNLRFDARKDEDALFLSDFYSEVERAVLMPDITYNYVLRPGSITPITSR